MHRQQGLLRTARTAALVLSGWIAFFGLEAAMSAAISPKTTIGHRAVAEIDLCIAVLWAALSPVIVAWHRRVRSSAPTAAALIALHLPLLVAAALIDCAITRILILAITGTPPAVPFFATAVYYADFDVVSYVGVVAIAEALLVRRTALSRQRLAQRLEASLGRARLDYLEAQLQPHFLFNSLGAVSELAFDAPATANRILQQLIAIFRTALATKSDEITLGEEIVGIEPYLDIQRIRFADWLTIEYRVADNAVDCVLPRFVLQPLVENAIRHGLSGRTAAGTIEISASVAGDVLTVCVADNGVGVDAAAPSTGRGIGLANLRDRLAILYGDDDRLRLLDNPGGGAVVELTIPARRRAEAAAHTDDLGAAPLEADLRVLRIPSVFRRPVVAVVSVWALFGLLWTQQSYVYDMIRHLSADRSWFSMAAINMTSAMIWAALTPIVLSATRRYPIQRDAAMVSGGAYIVSGLVVTFVHAGLLEQIAERDIPLFTSAWQPTLAIGFAIFWILVAVGHRGVFVGWLRAREEAAATLTVELADAQTRAQALKTIPAVLLDALDGIAGTVRTDASLTERQLTRLADYLRAALECSDARGVTPEREIALDGALAALRASGAYSSAPVNISKTLTRSA